MARTTRREVEAIFILFCKTMGTPHASNYPSAIKGAWMLDHDSTGYLIHEKLQDGNGGGVHEPFGSRRRTSGEMVEVMRFAIAALTY